MDTDTKPIYGYPQYPLMVFRFGNNPHMDIAKTIAANLAVWMDSSPGLDTFKKVAAKSGVGFGTVQRAKNGDGNITVEKLAALAKAFGRHPAELMIEQPRPDLDASCRRYPSATDSQPLPMRASEPTAIPITSPRAERVAAINDLLAQMDDYGLVAMLEKAKDVARDYPAQKTKTAS